MTVRLDVVGIIVTDLPRSLGFYRALGLDIPAGSDATLHVEVTLPGGVRLTWDSAEVMNSFDPDWTPSAGDGDSLSIAFLCDSPDEVDALYGSVTAAGYAGHLPPWDAFWGQRYATLHDPDGNRVDLFAPLPEAG